MVDPLVIERKKLFEHVAAHLEAQILSGKLKPGDQLPPERDLQSRFGVGRPAIREALISLQKAGLVELTNGARAKVLMPTARHIFTGMAPAVRQMLSTEQGQRYFQGARMFFEVGLAREAARTATPDDLRIAARRARSQPPGDRRSRALHQHRHRVSLRAGAHRPQPRVRGAARPDLGMAEGTARRHAGGERPGADRLRCASRHLRGDRRARSRPRRDRRCATISTS